MRKLQFGTGIVLSATMVLSFAGASFAVETVSAPAPADAQNTCPDGVDGWKKVDGTSEDSISTYPLTKNGTQRGTATENDPSKGLVSVRLDSGWAADLCVKGGTTVVFAYGLTDGQNSSVEVLGGSGNPADISHFSYRLIPPKVADQWCSPGFWRNNYGAWELTGYSTSSIDSVTEETFGVILKTPKKYARTGDFERIADMLSTAHPDVSFGGKRESDACPLSADRSSK